MPRVKLTKNSIDSLPTSTSDMVYWDTGCPGFGVKVTPKGRKVFVVLYRTGGAGSSLRKYTIGVFGRVTLHQARVAAQRVFAARLDGRDPALRNGQRSKGSWPIASMNCWRPSLPSMSRRIARPPRSLAFCAGRSARTGVTRAFMRSASVILLNSYQRSSNAKLLSLRTRP